MKKIDDFFNCYLLVVGGGGKINGDGWGTKGSSFLFANPG